MNPADSEGVAPPRPVQRRRFFRWTVTVGLIPQAGLLLRLGWWDTERSNFFEPH
jgi:hypothetical protein